MRHAPPTQELRVGRGRVKVCQVRARGGMVDALASGASDR